MEAVTTLPFGRPLNVADLDLMPDDGHRYELIDGTLIVSPAPGLRHQLAHAALMKLLMESCPDHLRVISAPFQVTLADDTGVQPDLLVAPLDAFSEKDLPGAPTLAVEILSPSTRVIDLNVKRSRYERAGVTSYWVIDPLEPRLLVWQLVDRAYAEVADITGDQQWTASLPFVVTVVPAALVD
jgi:Uma2 family endonuclease